jgi:hypothetical protein
MLVWDHCFYGPRSSGEETDERLLRRALRCGSIAIDFYGTKLKGRWLLVREGDIWFLQKAHDEYASTEDPKWDDRSSLTGISIEDVP